MKKMIIGEEDSSLKYYLNTYWHNKMSREFWWPNELYKLNIDVEIDTLIHKLKGFKKKGASTLDVIKVLNNTALGMEEIESDAVNFYPFLKDPDLLTDNQLASISELLGRFKKNASNWSVELCKSFLRCDSSAALNIQDGKLQYVCFIMDRLTKNKRIVLYPKWFNYVEKYDLFKYNGKIDAHTLQVNVSQINAVALTADSIREGDGNMAKEEYERRMSVRNESSKIMLDKYKIINELEDKIKSL